MSQGYGERDWSRVLRNALTGGEMMLYAQPVVPLTRSGRPQHELLLRMTLDGQVISPGPYLAFAERSDLIVDIDRWVIINAVKMLSQRTTAQPPLQVNVSARSVCDPDLSGWIAEILRTENVDARGLIFELTETAQAEDLGDVAKFAGEVRNLGCGFALDDFGAGYTSLRLVKHLPLDYLKIDGQFIRNLASDPVDQALARTIAQLGRRLGVRTIAECVEDAASLQLLADYGYDFAQGYHLGRPAPADEFV